MKINQFSVRLESAPSRVVIRPFHIASSAGDTVRGKRIVKAVTAMAQDECARLLEIVNADFSARHWQTREVFLNRYNHVAEQYGLSDQLSELQRELIGAYFCHEYSYAAAAITNPSIVRHIDQSGLRPGDQRFIMSLRTVGEGHISSIAFREGILAADGELSLWPQPELSIAATSEDPTPVDNVVAHRPPTVPISGMVMFPFTAAQRNGLEDLRLTRFQEDNGEITYYGTYTAYSGVGISSELLITKDFDTFELKAMQGAAAGNKGMALFPRRINGAYAMIGRQDGESVYFLQSDDLLRWDNGVLLLAPKYPWELVQIGNCGAPIELDEGWLLLTHGVGAVRKYSLGAALLDKKDPRKVLGRLPEPFLVPSSENRSGYVPNVLYTCGALKHGNALFLPYGVADSSVSFAMLDLPSLLAEMH